MICLVWASRSSRFWTSATFSSSRLCAAESASWASCSAACSSWVRCSMYDWVCASTRASVRWRTRRLRSATNELSPTRLSIAFRKNVTLSKFRFPGPSLRISKNCSEMKSTSAMKIARRPGFASAAAASPPPVSPPARRGRCARSRHLRGQRVDHPLRAGGEGSDSTGRRESSSAPSGSTGTCRRTRPSRGADDR